MYFFFIVKHFASIPVFLSTGGLTSHTCIYGHIGMVSETSRKKGFQTSEGLAANISTEAFHPSRGGFSDQVTLYRVQTSLRWQQYREIASVNSLPACEICIRSKTL